MENKTTFIKAMRDVGYAFGWHPDIVTPINHSKSKTMQPQLLPNIPEFQIKMNYKVKPSELYHIQSSEDVAKVARLCFEADKIEWVESFIVIALSQSNKVLGFYKASSGGITGTVADPRVIFQFALLSNANQLIIAHNHPSGQLKPSEPDKALTKKIVESGKMLDIKVLDHVIVTSEGYF